MMKEADGYDIDLPLLSSLRSICLFILHCYRLMACEDGYNMKNTYV